MYKFEIFLRTNIEPVEHKKNVWVLYHKYSVV